jgi:hypothetical protein
MICATPEPPGLSVADNVTCTAVLYQPFEQDPPLHAIVLVGGIVSATVLWTPKDTVADVVTGPPSDKASAYMV